MTVTPAFHRWVPLIIALVISAGLWIAGMALMPPEQGAFLALSCDESVPDREVRERLERQGLKALMCESTQWALLDTFGGMEQIPLDEYHQRVLPFDPRNDGYADRLRGLFVRGGRRFFYIPRQMMAEKKIAAALDDIPYSIKAPSNRAGVCVILFILAVSAFYVFLPLRNTLRFYSGVLIPCVPVLAPLELGGAAGLALASLLAGFAAHLAVSHQRFIPKRKLRRFLPLLLITAYGFSGIACGLSPVFLLLVLAALCGILVFSLRWTNNAQKLSEYPATGRRRFSPVLILKPPIPWFAFSWAMLPLAAAALAASVLTVPSRAVPLSHVPRALITEADYQRHYLHQSTFSHKALHAEESSGAIHLYDIDSDGLIMSNGFEIIPLAGIPPFPLGALLEYLNTAGRSARTVSPNAAPGTALLVLLPFLFILPAALHRKTQPRPTPLRRLSDSQA